MSKSAHLNFNAPAPDLSLTSAVGETVHLGTLWASRPLLLIFVRHFGCPQCKALLDFVTQNNSRFEAVPLAVAIVTQGTPAEALEFCRVHAPGQLCLADPKREAYRAYGIERAGLRQTFLSPRVWLSNWRLGRLKGYQTELPPPGQDAMQMAAVFVIGTDGHIRLPYYYDDIADHPPLELLLSGIFSTGWEAPFDGPLGVSG